MEKKSTHQTVLNEARILLVCKYHEEICLFLFKQCQFEGISLHSFIWYYRKLNRYWIAQNLKLRMSLEIVWFHDCSFCSEWDGFRQNDPQSREGGGVIMSWNNETLCRSYSASFNVKDTKKFQKMTLWVQFKSGGR